MRRSLVVSAGLAAMVLLAYYPVAGLGFVSYDDHAYILDNFHVRTGLLLSNIAWAFTRFSSANWHPLTWISHMADVEFHGLAPAGHHLTSLLFHAINTVLLFLLVRSMTGAAWKSAGVAALFGVHPLHVESVAWVAERKDVLSTLLLFLAFGAYLRYLRRPCAGRFLPVVIAFGLGLMAKPMVVTFPFLLLLLDYWPLGRLRPPGLKSLVLEKTPLLLLAAASSAVTYAAQRAGGALLVMEKIPLPARLENAVLSCLQYAAKTFWPAGLTAVYPHPGGGIPLWKSAAAALFVAAVSLAAVRWRRRLPFLAVGWAWYVGMLVPVIGVVQVGPQAMADRYTYVPLVGLFIALLWSADLATARLPRRGLVAGAVAAAVLPTLMLATRAQIGTWRDSRTLFERAIEAVPGNWAAHNYLGVVHEKEGRFGEALEELSRAIAIRPDYVEAHINRGVVLNRLGLQDEALKAFQEALRHKPDSADVRNNIGFILFSQGRAEEAVSLLESVLRGNPGHASTHYNLGVMLPSRGRPAEAIEHLRAAVRIRPEFPEAHLSLGLLLLKAGNADEAAAHFRETLRYNPGETRARAGLEAALGSGDNGGAAWGRTGGAPP